MNKRSTNTTPFPGMTLKLLFHYWLKNRVKCLWYILLPPSQFHQNVNKCSVESTWENKMKMKVMPFRCFSFCSNPVFFFPFFCTKYHACRPYISKTLKNNLIELVAMVMLLHYMKIGMPLDKFIGIIQHLTGSSIKNKN